MAAIARLGENANSRWVLSISSTSARNSQAASQWQADRVTEFRVNTHHLGMG